MYVTTNLGQDTYSLGIFDPETGTIEDLFEKEGTDVTNIGFTPTEEAITVLYNDINTKTQRH